MARDSVRDARLRFGQFVLDADGRDLRCGDHPVHVQPRVFALLQYLAERPGVALAREELLQTIWESTAVEDGSLSRAIRGARAALRGDPSLRNAIRTVRGFGYRFDVAVERVSRDHRSAPERLPRFERDSSSPPDSDRLEKLLRRRMEGLSPVECRVIEAASVAGVLFDTRLLAAALERSRVEIEAACDRLFERGWIVFQGFDTWPDGTSGARLRFSQPCFAEALSARIPSARRRALHRRIADRLEVGHAGNAEFARVIAAHYERAGV